jgi:zinc transport system substrate-binding protein
VHRISPGLAAVALLTAACGGTADEQAGAAATAPSLTAAAAVYPLAWLAQGIAPDAEVEFLGAGSAEAHDLELTPGQRGAVESADVLLYMGEIGYQPQIEQAAGSAQGEVVDVSEVVGQDRLLTATDAHEDEAHAEGDGEEHAEGESEGEEHAEGEGAVDPHVWFDPALMAEVAERAGAAFAAADPDNADTYTANAERVSADLTALASDIDAALSDCRFDEAIVSHAAYGYLLEPRGYGQHAVVGVTSGEAGASGAELAEIVAEVQREGFTHVLAEPVEGRADAEAVAREAGVEMLEVQPLDVVAEDSADQGYPELLRKQVDAFATALGCP